MINSFSTRTRFSITVELTATGRSLIWLTVLVFMGKGTMVEILKTCREYRLQER